VASATKSSGLKYKADGKFVLKDGKHRKTFRQRRPDPTRPGAWLYNMDTVQRIPYRLPQLIEAVANNHPVVIVEGELKADRLAAIGIVATCNPGGAGKWQSDFSEHLRGAAVFLCPDSDAVGRNHMHAVAETLVGVASSIRVLTLPNLPPKGDVIDWMAAGGTREALDELMAAAPVWTKPSQVEVEVKDEEEWPDPKPIPRGLLPVDAFSLDFLPDAFRSWVGDISDRLQCPPDYVAVATLVAYGSVLGRRIGIKPQMKTPWAEVANIWGCFIGRPGSMKSPAMNEALKPLHRLEADAIKNNEIAKAAYEAGMSAFKLRQSVAASLMKKELKKGDGSKINTGFNPGEEPQEPKVVRYRTNDSSYEALGELLKHNPMGILVERDELISLLKHLDHEDQTNARGFFLSGASGQQGYSFDRIGRGHIGLEAVCISVLGGTQPARISEYVRRANLGGAGGDGLIQRFGLLVWPDAPTTWRNVDEYPNSIARERARMAFDRAAALDIGEALKLGAHKDQFEAVPYLRFDEDAYDDFIGWQTSLEMRLRSGELPAALEGHFSKYRKLVPALALINAIADEEQNFVSQEALTRAIAFSRYLESHALRVYGSAAEGEVSAATMILKRIKADELADGFTAREVVRHGWTGLTDADLVAAGLTLLCDLDSLAAEQSTASPVGGRPKTTFTINPKLKAEVKVKKGAPIGTDETDETLWDTAFVSFGTTQGCPFFKNHRREPGETHTQEAQAVVRHSPVQHPRL
jgi:hypothetical protein